MPVPFRHHRIPLLILTPLLAVLSGCDGAGDQLEEAAEEDDVATSAPATLAGEEDEGLSPYLDVTSDEQYGSYLINREGQPLYLFTPDSAGTPTCYDECAAAWPPFVAGTDEPRADDPLDSDLVGTVERRDGRRQVTYAGWPLYFYAEDRSGAPTGQDVHSHGGEWYLLTPEGEKVHAEEGEG